MTIRVNYFRRDTMYRVVRISKIIDGEVADLFGVEDYSLIALDFTATESEAEALACLLNENAVEPIHVTDIIEDLFYSG